MPYCYFVLYYFVSFYVVININVIVVVVFVLVIVIVIITVVIVIIAVIIIIIIIIIIAVVIVIIAVVVVGNILNRIQLKIFLLESELLDVTFYVIIIFFSYTYLFEFGVISKQISLFFASVISILLSGEPFLVAEFKIILLSEDFLLSTLWRA